MGNIIGFTTEYDGRNVSFDEYFELVEKGEDPGALPIAILHGIKEMLSSNENVTGYRVSSLLGCSRRAFFDATIGKHVQYVKPSEVYAMFRGSIAHKVMEDYPIKGSVDETRFQKEIDGVIVTGKPDRIIPSQKKIVDYKTVKKVPEWDRVYLSHEKQLNVYRWLVKDIYEINELEIMYMDMETAKTLKARVWSDLEVETFVREKVHVLDDAILSSEAPKYKKVPECAYCPFVSVCRELVKEELMDELKDKVLAGKKVSGKDVDKIVTHLTK